MENKGNPRTKGFQKKSSLNQSEGPLFDGPSPMPSNEKEHLYFEITLNNGRKKLTLPNLKNNLVAFKKLTESKVQPPSSHLIESEKGFQRNLNSFSKSFKKLNNSLIKITPKSSLKNTILRKKTIDQLHSELYSWHSLLRHFVSMPIISNFNICQVLCHEKGTTNVFSYTYGEEKRLIESKVNIDSFNKVFNQIKKSKSKQFSQTQLSISEFNFTGSFLASPFQLKTHNILFLLSENSFFPISQSSIHEIKLITPQIKDALERGLDKDISDSKNSNLFTLLEFLPIPLSIIDSFENIIYQNELYKREISQENTHSNITEFSLSNDHKLLILSNSSLRKSDIQHFQRVSLLGELLNTLQHELSNPLFGIKLATDFLNLRPTEESIKLSLSEISEYCNRCQNIIRDFKFIYKDGNQFLNVDLKKIIKETLTLTKSASRGIKKEIIYTPNLESFELTTNPTWLSQIIFNLIINSSQAIISKGEQFLLQGKIKISISNKENGLVSITIEDNGPGIKEKSVHKLFDPFFTTKEKGTGLGLSICQNLAGKLGGEITYKKSHMGGASFSLLLPINEIS